MATAIYRIKEILKSPKQRISLKLPYLAGCSHTNKLVFILFLINSHNSEISDGNVTINFILAVRSTSHKLQRSSANL